MSNQITGRNDLYESVPQFVYITNEEEIKEGGWFIHSSHGVTNLYKAKSVAKESVITTTDEGCWMQYCKKVILTTDQTLIDNGIQPIDEEFLQWYVKNSSCEFVEVKREEDGHFVDYLADGSVEKGIYENYSLGFNPFSAENKYQGKVLTPEEVMESRSSAYEFINFNNSPEKEALEKIKFVLLSNNDAQAIRIIEQYGFWRENNKK